MPRSRWRLRRVTIDRLWQGGLAVALFVAAWHVASVTGLFGRIDPDYSLLLLPPPGVVAHALYDMARTGELWTNVGVSLTRVLIGFGLAVVIAVPLGLLMALSKVANNVFEPFVRVFSPIPGIAWVPLAILWFGLGNSAAIFIITLGSIFPILLGTIQGVRDSDPGLSDAARMMGASTRQTITRVLLPGLVPYLVTGFRTGMGFAWRVVIAAEMVGVPKGIGYMLNVGRSTGQTEVTVVTMLLLGALMLAAEELVFSPLEVRTRAWRTQEA